MLPRAMCSTVSGMGYLMEALMEYGVSKPLGCQELTRVISDSLLNNLRTPLAGERRSPRVQALLFPGTGHFDSLMPRLPMFEHVHRQRQLLCLPHLTEPLHMK